MSIHTLGLAIGCVIFIIAVTMNDIVGVGIGMFNIAWNIPCLLYSIERRKSK